MKATRSCLDLPARAVLPPSGLETTKRARPGHLRSCARTPNLRLAQSSVHQFPERPALHIEQITRACAHDLGVNRALPLTELRESPRCCHLEGSRRTQCSTDLCNSVFKHEHSIHRDAYQRDPVARTPSDGAALHGAAPLQPGFLASAAQGVNPYGEEVAPTSVAPSPSRPCASNRSAGQVGQGCFPRECREAPRFPQPRTTESPTIETRRPPFR